MLHIDGFEILHQAIQVEPDEYEEIKRQSRGRMRTIFNDNEMSKRNDHKRKQIPIKKNVKTKRLLSKLDNILQKRYSKLKMNEVVILHSKIGCKEQGSHQDYEPNDIFVNGNTNEIPLSAVLALEETNTGLVVWRKSIRISSDDTDISNMKIEKEIVKINRGDILVFRGDLVHAGSGYEEENTRIHCFFGFGKSAENKKSNMANKI